MKIPIRKFVRLLKDYPLNSILELNAFLAIWAFDNHNATLILGWEGDHKCTA